MRGEIADPQARAERLREAADVDDAVQLVELGDAVRAPWMQVGEDVVLDDVEVVRLGEPQHLGTRRRRRARCRSGCGGPSWS